MYLEINDLEELKDNFDELAFLRLKFAGLITLVDKLEIPVSLKNKLNSLLQIHVSIEPSNWLNQNINILTQAIEKGVCPNNIHISMHVENLGCDLLPAIIDALQIGKCPENLAITLTTQMVTKKCLLDLAELVKAQKLSRGFLFTLEDCVEVGSWISHDITEPFFEILQSGNFPEDVTINLCGDIYARNQMLDSIEMLSSGQCPNNLRLDFSNTDDENSESEDENSEAEDENNDEYTSDHTPPEDKIFLIKGIAAALASGKCPQNLSLNFSRNKYGDTIAIVIAEALQSGNCPANLELNLSRSNITDIGIKAIAEALQSRSCPADLKLDLSATNITDIGIKVLAEALQSGKCAPGLSLDLTGNVFGDEGLSALAKALTSGKCAAKLRIDFGTGEFEHVGTQAMLAALASGQCPKNLELIINGKLEGFIKPLLGTRIIPGTQSLISALKSGHCPDGFSLTIHSNSNEKVDIDEALAIAEVLESGCCPTNFKIDLPDHGISYEGIEVFTKVLKSANCPNNLTLGHIDLSSYTLASILEDKNCPSGLQLYGFHYWNKPDETLIQALLSNTKVTHIEYNSILYSFDSDKIERLYAVQYCCLRNRLLQQFPDLAPVIKKIAHQAGMYLPKIEQEAEDIPSLQNLAYSCILFKNVKTHSALPITLFNELTTLKTLHTALNLKATPKLNS